MHPIRLLLVAAFALTACEDTENGITAPCGFGNPCTSFEDVVASVGVSLEAGPFIPGDTTSLVATVRDAQGEILDVPVSFESSDPTIATIDTLGRIRAIRAGTVTITAQAGNRSDSVTFNIVALVATQLGVGDDAACLTTNVPGRQYCWGLADAGQLGVQPDTFCFADDTLVTGTRSCAITPYRTGLSLNFSTISVGDSLSCGLTGAGAAYCWGDDEFGQLGRAGAGGEGPQRVHGIGAAFTSISAGGRHACGIAGATTYCWGEDSLGQLGDARRINSTTPIPVVTSETFTQVSAGLRHTCALNAAGSAYCWGNNEAGQVGRGTFGNSFDTPQPVIGGHTFTQVSAGDSASCGLGTNGVVRCWGSNTRGQLGIGIPGGASGVPQQVAGTETFVAVSTGGDFACALNAGGSAFCWGSNSYGQIGIAGGNSPAPRAVSGDLVFTQLGAGARHACGLNAAGDIYCWGSNVFGALGNNLQAAARGQPVLVDLMP